MEDRMLLEHNIEPYKKLEEAFKRKNRACAIQPTGTGKMYLAIKWFDSHPNEPFIYIAPTNVILNSFVDKLVDIYFPSQASRIKRLSLDAEIKFLKKNLNPNLKLMTYAKVNMLTDYQMRDMEVERIVLDEFHHLGADKWGASVENFLNIHEDAKVLGLTATPVRAVDGKDMVKYLFNNEKDSEITLRECFEKGILQKPTLINGIYSFDKEIVSLENSLKTQNFSPEKRKEIEEKLKQAKKLIGRSHHGIKEIFEENLKQFERKNSKLDTKLIVFCNSIEDRHRKMAECKTWFKAGTKIKKYSVTSDESKETVNKVIKNFEKDDAKCIKLIFVVDMLNEGLHIKGVDGVVMLRSTESHIVFTQQLGRGLSIAKSKGKSPLVFDLVNNIEVLDNDIEEVKKTGLTFIRGVNSPKDEIEDSPFKIQAEIIDIVRYLKSISRDFNDRIAPLVEYYNQNGTIGDIQISDNYEKLGKLIHYLRTDYRKGKLSLIQIETLEKMGMVWKVEKKAVRPAFKKFVDEYLKFMATNTNIRLDENLYCKYKRYTDLDKISKEEADYLIKNGIKPRQVENKTSEIKGVRKAVIDAINKYLKFLETNKREPSWNAGDKEECNIYQLFKIYTNQANLSKEEKEYVESKGIKLRKVEKKESSIENVRVCVQEFAEKYVEFIQNYGRQPKKSKINQEENKLYRSYRTYGNPENLSEEEIDYLKSKGIPIKEREKRENKLEGVRLCVQDFVRDFKNFIEEKHHLPKRSDDTEERNLRKKMTRYTDVEKGKLNEREIKYLQDNGIEVRNLEEQKIDDVEDCFKQ